MRGLTSTEAARRLVEVGPNLVATSKTRGRLGQLGRRLGNPLVLILLCSSVASAAVGDVTNAAIVASIVLLSIAVEAFQTHRTERAADALRASVAQTAKVMRD